ncbi:MAG: type II/IV secretion system protein [Planctomycetales bacterium]|nr:type II/IV secretion system protein [Planctomycetales bacterium]
MRTAAPRDSSLPLIIQLLMPQREIDLERLESVRGAQLKENVPIEELLIRKGIASEQEIAATYAEFYLLPEFSPAADAWKFPPRLANLLPEKFCRDHLIVPVGHRDGKLDVAFFTPNELLLIEELQLITGYEIKPCFATLSVVENCINALYDADAWEAEAAPVAGADFEEVEDVASLGDHEDHAGEEVVHLDQLPPPGRDGRVIRYVNQIFEQALKVGASDVHIEPLEDRCRIRLRVDGSLTEITPPAFALFTPIVSRIKVLAKMDIAEKRLPQDGAIALRAGSRRVDLRVNSCPTVHGEKIVLRVLDKEAIPLDPADLGLDARQSADLLESIQMPHGLLLVTGPTGSGKSTTLYACLNQLNCPDTNICTVEDPVEYKMAGINQVQTKAQVGFNFASALRAFLRQDPDVIMVGEVRDSETAQICLRAALTGHFVLSTLHTNDALAAVNRLVDMDIEPFLLASTLRAVVAQRLIRRLCLHCREAYSLDSETAERVGLPAGETLYRPVGCKDCRMTGYKGRVGVFEVIRITAQMSDLIQRKATLAELRQLAQSQGMKLLAQTSREKVREGLTSLEEALSVTVSQD